MEFRIDSEFTRNYISSGHDRFSEIKIRFCISRKFFPPGRFFINRGFDFEEELWIEKQVPICFLKFPVEK
ncbi:hypothetical protein DLM75_21455 [Leptospira stimsonii]|uniref:Uncharacterized protein n=1 Tax=Leptospira stimsonii TaxID=2202203 RepID=A0A396YVV0_9LEPT|nr:hypothetical protein DLM75_21455 [Leptospira stimsonii]